MTGSNSELVLLSKLQDWFRAECNGDWEHTFGFRLETLDNPGWTFEADLEETRWEGTSIARRRLDRTEFDWIQYEITENKYIACGGAGNLIEMLGTFFAVLNELDAEIKNVEPE